MKFVTRDTIDNFIKLLKREIQFSCRVYLIGDSSLVYNGWQNIADQLEISANIEIPHQLALANIIQRFKMETGIEIINMSPADVIPLPDGYEERAVKITTEENGTVSGPQFFHFDPYSVSFRFIARGDETDYKMVMNYIKNGWVDFYLMGKMLDDLLPSFSFSTIQQDPAEFRRKYKGLSQMFKASNIA